MDPAIMKKLLEEDEDESMHSGAEVEAFTAALNRDIEGDASKLQRSIPGCVLPAGSSQTDSQMFQQWQSSGVKNNDGSGNLQGQYETEAMQHLNKPRLSEGRSNPENVEHEHRPAERSSAWDEHGHHQGETGIAFPSSSQPHVEQTSSKTEEKHVSPLEHKNNQNTGGEFHPPRAQRMNIQAALDHSGSGKRVPFASLLPVITPQLEKDKAMQLQTLYQKLKRNEIPKDGFVRHMKSIVGDHILRVAVMQMHAHMPRQVLAQQKQQPQVPAHGAPKLQHELTNSSSAEPFEVPYPLAEGGQLLDMERRQQQAGPKMSAMDGPPPSIAVNQESFRPSQQLQGLSRQHPPQPSSSYLMYRPNNSANLFKTDADSPIADCGIRHHNVPQPLACSYQQQPIAEASNVNELPVTVPGVSPKVIPKKASSVGQKRPPESTPASPQGSSKKQKPVAVGGLGPDQSIDQLNDVTAVSGVNLREEEEHMFSEAAAKGECGGIHEASRRVVQEEEEQLLLQRIPLQKKLERIMARCGGPTIVGNDVERCLSLCVEERLRGLITCLIRSSRQRASSDADRTGRRVVVTSDVRQQIFLMNQRIRDEQQQAAAPRDEISQKESEGREGIDVSGGGARDKARGKASKQQQQPPPAAAAAREEDERTRATAANVAARAAVGGDDMLSKWQLMAEQARQKRDGAVGGNHHFLVHPQHAPDGGEQNPQQQQRQRQQRRLQPSATTVSVRDVIAVLEREPHMAKSTLMYRLYDKTSTP